MTFWKEMKGEAGMKTGCEGTMIGAQHVDEEAVLGQGTFTVNRRHPLDTVRDSYYECCTEYLKHETML